MMRPCERCLENKWTYVYVDGWVTATCEHCGHEVMWDTMIRKKRVSGGRRITVNKRSETVVGAHFKENPGFTDDGKPPWD